MGNTYTPYDGSTRPFTMGLRPLTPDRWFEPDCHAYTELRQKQRLITQTKDSVFRATQGTKNAQEETLYLIRHFLKAYYPNRHHWQDDTVKCLVTDKIYSYANFTKNPLLLAGLLLQDDLCLITPTPQGPILSAASLCFPSSWRLDDKIGKTLDVIHAPVPNYQEDMADKVNRMMHQMPDDRIVWRMNWSLDEGPDMHRPAPHSHDAWLAQNADPFNHLYIRVERQTLRKLPKTGSVLFTIRIYTDALQKLQQHDDFKILATGLRHQLADLTSEQCAYKGLIKARPVIISALDEKIAKA